jgi:hypothetical protein
MQETLYSYTCINSIKRIANIRQALTSGTLSGIGLGGISGLSNIEIKERISDIVGISNNELLKTSLSQAMDNVNILSPSTNLLEFIGQYVKNIITNFFKQFTYEDTLNSLENFNTDTYNEDIKTFMDGEVLPMIIIEMENLDFENVKEKEDFRFLGKIKKTFSKIINLLRGDED